MKCGSRSRLSKESSRVHQQKAAYDKALEENAKAAYDAKVVSSSDKANAEAKAGHDAENGCLQIQRKRNTIKDYKNTKLKKAQYDKDKAAYDQLVAISRRRLLRSSFS